MHKILQAHLLRAFVANLKFEAIQALNTESFCDPNLAIRKVFAFSDLGVGVRANAVRYQNPATFQNAPVLDDFGLSNFGLSNFDIGFGQL